jgi:hypothetical protein
MGWLTSRKERIVLSSADEASPAANAIRDFAKMRGLSLDDAKVQDWNTTPPQRTWIGLEGAEAGWFCYTDFLNARKYTKKQRQHICCQLLSEAQSWDIGEYQLMMHDSTKRPQRTEQNFCPRCGKRTPDLITIHTCTPPQEGT